MVVAGCGGRFGRGALARGGRRARLVHAGRGRRVLVWDVTAHAAAAAAAPWRWLLVQILEDVLALKVLRLRQERGCMGKSNKIVR